MRPVRTAQVSADRRFRRTHELPVGSFDVVSDALLCWRRHRAAGLRVDPRDPVRPGGEHVVRLGVGPFAVRAPVRVVEVIDDRDVRGFVYEARPGHPERGWESFRVERDGHAERFVVESVSAPRAWWLRALGPGAAWAQDVATARYLRAASRVAGRH